MWVLRPHTCVQLSIATQKTKTKKISAPGGHKRKEGHNMSIGKINDVYCYNGVFYVILNKGYSYAPTGLHYFTYTDVSEGGKKLNSVVPCSCVSCME